MVTTLDMEADSYDLEMGFGAAPKALTVDAVRRWWYRWFCIPSFRNRSGYAFGPTT